MKSLIVGDKPTVARLAERLKRAGSHAEYQRIQCVLIRATLGNLGEEHRHGCGVDPGQHQAVHHAVVRTDGAEGIDVLALQPRAHDRPHVVRCPASSRCAQQAEAAFVLEHQPHRATLLSLAIDLLAYRAAQFF